MKWSGEMDRLLLRCRRDGLTMEAATRTINNRFDLDLSKSAVIGRADRLGVPKITKPLRPKKKVSFPPEGELPEPTEDDIPTKTFDELEARDGCCRWRIDKTYRGQPYGFCGKQIILGSRYEFCEQHHRRAFPGWPEVKHKVAPKEPAEAKPEMETA